MHKLVFVLAMVLAACNTATVQIPETAPLSELTWSRVPSSTELSDDHRQFMSSIAGGGSGFIAVGYTGDVDGGDAAVWSSPDGIAWTRIRHSPDLSSEDKLAMYSITAGGPGFVAVGRAGVMDDADAAVWTSTDGFAWSRVPHSADLGSAEKLVMTDVAAGGPGLVAVGWSGDYDSLDAAVWTSTDGFAWTRVPHSEDLGGSGAQSMSAVTAGGAGASSFVAVGSDNAHAAVWRSRDGIVWNRIRHSSWAFGDDDEFSSMSDVAAGGPGFVAVGSGFTQGYTSGTAVWTSSDGFTWTRIWDQVFYGREKVGATGVAVGTSGIVAVGYDRNDFLDSNAAVWTSPDGDAWTRVPDSEAVFGGEPSAHMAAVAVGMRGFVAVGSAGTGEFQVGESIAAVWEAASTG